MSSHTASTLFGDAPSQSIGNIGIRVVVLPQKSSSLDDDDSPLDRAADEVLPDDSASPVASYLERRKGGKLCCVFLVNGQRHDGLDNTFIIQQLGLKYLRKRMMVVVDVDGLKPKALGELIQGSRQGFYKGHTWEAIFSRVIATLKNDPDLLKLEEEAEAQVSQLQSGDQKVRAALDTLIEAHHAFADHLAGGAGLEPGHAGSDPSLGVAHSTDSASVALATPTEGSDAELPVITGDKASLLVRPDESTTLSVRSNPANAWPALATLTYSLDDKVPELRVQEDRLSGEHRFGLKFSAPSDFDDDDYPIRTTMRIFARFNGFKDPRSLAIPLTIKPNVPVPPPVLKDEPTFLRVTSRQPVKIYLGDAPSHTRLKWDGKDELAIGPKPAWRLGIQCLTKGREILLGTFSEPRQGRIALIIPCPSNAVLDEHLSFEVVAVGPNGRTLKAGFEAVVVEKMKPAPLEPRLLEDHLPAGAQRRPPYVLKFVNRVSGWDTPSCWEGMTWTTSEAAAFQDPTEKAPLTLIINDDFGTLEAFRKFMVDRKLTESEIQSRLSKYTSHVAYHLYQMYQASKKPPSVATEEASTLSEPSQQRAEANRVALTLINLMQISR